MIFISYGATQKMLRLVAGVNTSHDAAYSRFQLNRVQLSGRMVDRDLLAYSVDFREKVIKAYSL